MTEPLLQTLEDRLEGIVDDVQDFMIMVLKRHLEIQPYELRQVSVGI